MGTIQAPPGVNIPAVLLPLLQTMAQTDTTFPIALALTSLLMENKINFGVMGGSECKY